MAELTGEQWDKLNNSRRSVVLVIKNDTPYEMRFLEAYFNTGEWVTNPPATIPAGSNANIYAASCGAGVCAGFVYELLAKPQSWYIVMGFTNPVFGWNKCYIGIESDKPQAVDGYNGADDGTAKSVREGGIFAMVELQPTKNRPGITGNNMQQILFKVDNDPSEVLQETCQDCLHSRNVFQKTL